MSRFVRNVLVSLVEILDFLCLFPSNMSTMTNSVSVKVVSLSINKAKSYDNLQRRELDFHCEGPIVSDYIYQRCQELHTNRPSEEIEICTSHHDDLVTVKNGYSQ